jgi:hypothetical protein
MKPLHYYSIRVTTPTGNCSRRIAQIPDTEAPNTEAYRLAGPDDKVEYKYLGAGKPLHKAFGPMGQAFHTAEQRISYEKGLQGHCTYGGGSLGMTASNLDDFSYLGQADAEIVWDLQSGQECEQ